MVATLAISTLWLRATNAELTVELKEEQRANAIALADQRYLSAVDSWKESFEIFSEELQDVDGALPARKRIVERALQRLKELADTGAEIPDGTLAALKARTLRAGLLRVEGANPREAQAEYQQIVSQVAQFSLTGSQTELFAVHADTLIGLVECDLALQGGKDALNRFDDLERLADSRPKDVSDFTLALAADNLDVYRVRIRRRIDPGKIESYAIQILLPALDRNRSAQEDLKNGSMTVNLRLADFAKRRNPAKETSVALALSRLMYSESLLLDELCFSMASTPDAIGYAEQSSTICSELVERYPDDKEFAAALVAALTNFGRFKKDMGDLAGAQETLEDAVAGAVALRKKHPYESNLLELRRTAEHNLANTYVSGGDFGKAKAIFESQIEEAGQITEETTLTALLDLAQSYLALGNAEKGAGEDASAFDAYLRSQVLRSTVAAKDPSNSDNIAEAAVLSRYVSETVTGADSWIMAADKLEELQNCVLQHVSDGRVSNPLAIGQPAIVVTNLIDSLSKISVPTDDMLARGRRLLDNAEELTTHVKGIPLEAMQQLNDAIREARARLEANAG